MITRPRFSIDALPWFADDEAIGQAVLGLTRAREWKQIAALLEGRGLPKIDPLMGARYVPAVRAYFDRDVGSGAPDGLEDLAAWRDQGRRRRV
jgi:hypothetical protein